MNPAINSDGTVTSGLTVWWGCQTLIVTDAELVYVGIWSSVSDVVITGRLGVKFRLEIHGYFDRLSAVIWKHCLSSWITLSISIYRTVVVSRDHPQW